MERERMVASPRKEISDPRKTIMDETGREIRLVVQTLFVAVGERVCTCVAVMPAAGTSR